MVARVWTYLLLMSISISTPAQIIINQSFENQSFENVVTQLERDHDVQFYYAGEWITNLTVDGGFENRTLPEFLDDVLNGTGLSYLIYRERHIVLIKPITEVSKAEIVHPSKVAIEESPPVIVGDPKNGSTNEEVTITGYVREAATGEVIVGAALYLEELLGGTTSNVYGYYSIDLKPGDYNLRVSYLGWQEEQIKLKIVGSGQFNVELFEDVVKLEGITVVDVAEDLNVTGAQMGVTKLNISSIRTMPALFGESDVIKSIQLLPGVTTVGEGAQGFNVRGGSVGENLVLFEGAPLFNSSHLFGFFSLFNGELIKDASLYKGGVPAQYGGRSSSVLDVRLKDGNVKDWVGSGGQGLVTTRIAVEGPIQKDKTSLLIGARLAYPDWILNMTRNVELRRSSALFYDFNGKITHRLDDKNKVSLMGYSSLDRFKFQSDTLFRYRNNLGTLNWEHIFNDRLFSNVSVVSSDYDYEVEGLQNQFRFQMDYGIRYTGGKADISYYQGGRNRIDFGGSFGRYSIRPGKLRTLEVTSLIVDESVEDESAIESAAYISDEFDLSDNVSFLLGVRYSRYTQLGPEEVFQYEEQTTRSIGAIRDTLSFSSGEQIATYDGLEPRASIRFGLNRLNSIKASYNRLRQYIHLISNSAAITPFDVWKSSDPFLPPQISDQVALGYFQNFRSNEIESSVELFYRWIDNIPQFKNAADPILNTALETDIIIGDGRAYGTELMVRKNYGRLTGWLGYTLSRSERRANGDFTEERINDGQYYPADFDQTHNLTMVAHYKLSRRWKIAGNFTYNTGRPVTVPVTLFRVGDISQAQFSERNGYRIPDFHRLDVALTFDSGHRKNLKWESSWTLTFFNLYGRKNAFSVFFGRDEGSATLQPLKLSVLGSVFPSLTYNFSFR